VAEVALAGAIDNGSGSKAARRTVGIGQAGLLYARSVHIDPVNRPVSNLLSLSSFAAKSAAGFIRRVAISTVRFPSLEAQAIPEITYVDGMDLDKWEKDLDRISGQKREKGTIDFLIDGEEYFPRLMEAFDTARESIDIRTYIFDNDDFALEVADHLKRRSQDVEIRVLVDALGNLLATQADADSAPENRGASKSIETYLEQHSKIKVRSRANPWLTGDHTKTTIVDRKTAFVGGMNIGREYRYEWHDLMMEVTVRSSIAFSMTRTRRGQGPVFSATLAIFSALWLAESTKRINLGMQYVPFTRGTSTLRSIVRNWQRFAAPAATYSSRTPTFPTMKSCSSSPGRGAAASTFGSFCQPRATMDR
jgi:phosphatidylserine/phosphatidylglycerophosphate/cardiolipin synthase-like enzyme